MPLCTNCATFNSSSRSPRLETSGVENNYLAGFTVVFGGPETMTSTRSHRSIGEVATRTTIYTAIPLFAAFLAINYASHKFESSSDRATEPVVELNERAAGIQSDLQALSSITDLNQLPEIAGNLEGQLTSLVRVANGLPPEPPAPYDCENFNPNRASSVAAAEGWCQD